MSAALWAMIAAPLLTGAALAVAGGRANRFAPTVAVTVALADLGLAVLTTVTRPAARAPLFAGLPIHLAVDGLSGLMVLTVTGVTATVLLVGEVEPVAAHSRFFGLMLIFSGAMLTTVTAASLPALIMGWEVMGAASWALIGYWWSEPDRVDAANTAFWTTRTGDLGLYLAAGAALAGGSSLALADLPGTSGAWRDVVTAGVIVAAMAKSAQLPFSFWLARAMRGPSSVSALLHSATMVVAGAYLLLRLAPLLTASGWGGAVVAWSGAVTAVVLGLVAVVQTDLKQLLAASTCAQIGLMMLAAGIGAVTGGTLWLVAHAAAKSLAFLVAGLWVTALGTQTLTALTGAARAHRIGVWFTVALLTLGGLPPLALWPVKDLILAGALDRHPGLYAMGLAAGVVSVTYSLKVVWTVWRKVPDRHPAGSEPGGTPDAPGPVDSPRPVGGPVSVPPRPLHTPRPAYPSLLTLAAACVGLTALGFPPLTATVDHAVGSTSRFAWWGLGVSGGLALLVAGTSWYWRSHALPLPRVPGFLGSWLGLHTAARTLVVRPVWWLANRLAVFDDRVLDRAVDGVGRWALRLAGLTGYSERRADLARGVAVAVRAAGRAARVPQTGLLNQYLAQAVAAFAILALIVVLVG